ncbi:MAG: hypothetical protein KIG57_00650, partial [Muribaculaceae bacterium]|nr:hypothetical protein [Muribaculaceae bacterium]
MLIVEQKKRVVMRQISATMIFPFEFANLQKKIRFVAIVHPKTHAPPSSVLSSVLSLTTVESPLLMKE